MNEKEYHEGIESPIVARLICKDWVYIKLTDHGSFLRDDLQALSSQIFPVTRSPL